ncbi:MAG: hypothetical protein ACMG6E_07060 [Candidatus Roizmanbacteria bacterium]
MDTLSSDCFQIILGYLLPGHVLEVRMMSKKIHARFTDSLYLNLLAKHFPEAPGTEDPEKQYTALAENQYYTRIVEIKGIPIPLGIRVPGIEITQNTIWLAYHVMMAIQNDDVKYHCYTSFKSNDAANGLMMMTDHNFGGLGRQWSRSAIVKLTV